MLVSPGEQVFLLQNRGLDTGSVNETDFVLLGAALTTRSGQSKTCLGLCDIFSEGNRAI